MRICRTAAMVVLATMTFFGCTEDTKTTSQPDASQPDAFVRLDTPAQTRDTSGSEPVQTQPFELEGNWLYLGPWDGEHTLKIGKTSIEYAAIDGEWSSTWTLKDHDNGADHFRFAFDSGSGTDKEAAYPKGQEFSASYVVSEVFLTVQLSSGLGSYPQVESAGSCTKDDSTKIPDCRLYMKN